jgi:hypothetical protein
MIPELLLTFVEILAVGESVAFAALARKVFGSVDRYVAGSSKIAVARGCHLGLARGCLLALVQDSSAKSEEQGNVYTNHGPPLQHYRSNS